ncbi:ATP-binding cassette domain-containing protein [Evansella cellulosilytica]|uniref:ABC transporter related protein n=1 Tax=Evansella cellulosilytica (strain ATCC 21833 / DSM 2522 / FERM P-1141 / JCM 9156 / N-4) TaxID=649639 RepID=E6TUC8_EVAC2|nr:ABC transporter ATP-binding protein [Evansella cellulosilytica]ADU29684.1 ABC transporter related protein [Evansella cellulosilytica DSM 2522]
MKIKHLSKKINGVEVLSDINFEIKTGSIVGIIGRNGAGKTTLLRTMVGILEPSKGDVCISDKSIFTYPELKQDIIFVPDSSEALKAYSTREIITLYESIYPRFDIDYFHELMNRFSLPYVRKIGSYSKGMKALFSLVIAFSTKAKYILLDEPTDGLDVIVKNRVLKVLVEEVAVNEVSVIISSHRLDELEFMANEIVMIKEGLVDSHYELDAMKSQFIKAQIVFKKQLPEVVQNKVIIINQTGRVYTVLFNKDEEIESLIHEHAPILYEELSLSLEDIFIAKLGGDEFVS